MLKPDPRTAVSGGVVIAPVLAEAGLPEGLLHVLPGGPDGGEALVADPLVPVISFTGSTAAGRKVGEACGRLLKRAHLELGGNSALIVLDDADLDRAGLGGGVGLVPAPGPDLHDHRPPPGARLLADEYVERLAAKADHLPVGDPATQQVALGPLISQGQLDKVHALVTGSVEAGARLAAGGTYENLFYRPTVLGRERVPPTTTRCSARSPRSCSFQTVEEAVALAGDTEYGLSLGILTRDVMKAMHLAERDPHRDRPHQRPDRRRRGGRALRRRSAPPAPDRASAGPVRTPTRSPTPSG